MYKRLREEMERRNVKRKDIEKALPIDRRTLTNRLNGHRPFKLTEAFAIRNMFFPDKSIDYLFGEAEEKENGNV